MTNKEDAYIMLRYRQIHDFWHVLSGLPPTLLGEIAIQTVKGTYIVSLNLKFPSCFGGNLKINSSDSSLTHILCDGNPPKDKNTNENSRLFRVMYQHYSEFLTLLRRRINQILKDSYDREENPFVHVYCSRTHPNPCTCEILTLKPSQNGLSKKLTCGECCMDLCAGGCGRVYHGENDCKISFDEATKSLINSSSKACPVCRVNITKSEGCNHMTCTQCRAQFCFICGDEFAKDSYGHYKISEHFSDNFVGNIVRVARCRQFNL
jgi:hypothetical protein